MRYDSYAGDPRWITVRYSGECRGCKRTIKRGEDAFYYPRTKSLYCKGACGQAASRDFESCAEDEYSYGHS